MTLFSTRLIHTVKKTRIYIMLIASIVLGAAYIQQEDSRLLSWRLLLNDTGAPIARHENGYVSINSKFYLVGGRGTHSIQVYNPADSSWEFKAEPPNSISLHHFQAASIGDTLYILASYTGDFPDETAVENIYKYDVPSDTWVTGSEIPFSRRRAAAGVAAYNGKLYVVCGSTGGHGSSASRNALFDEYDPQTDTWTSLQDAPRARDHVQVAVINDKLYVAGGRNGDLPDTVSEVDVYDFNSGQWSTLPTSSNFPVPRSGASTVAVGKYVVVLGGESISQVDAHSEVHALDTETLQWIELNRLNVGRHGTQAVYFDEKIYVVAGAGERGGSPELIDHEVFDTMGETSLPVELAPDFLAIADDNTVQLQWSTISETNNAGFEIQHRFARGFESVGFMEGFGTSTITRKYQYTIDNLFPGKHTFRLKQIDFDGGFAFSPEVSVFVTLHDSHYLGGIYPNPMNPQARFELVLAREQTVRVMVYDILGREIALLHDGVLSPNISHSFQVDAHSWAGGKYLVQVEGEYFADSKIFTVLK